MTIAIVELTTAALEAAMLTALPAATQLSWGYDPYADKPVSIVAWHPDIFVLWDHDKAEHASNENDPGRAGGWVRVGALCSAGRRSMWMRVWLRRAQHTTGYVAARLELCAGREGGDAYLCLERDDPRFDAWYALFSTLLFAVDS